MKQSAEPVAVVGVDFQESGDEALALALRMLSQGALHTLHLLHVLDPRDIVDSPESPVLRTEEEVVEAAPSILLERALALSALRGIPIQRYRVRAHARVGTAVETLLQMTVDYDADMLIVGTHGRRGLDRLMLGSVAEMLVRTAHCPVLVARPRNYQSLEKTKLPDPPYAPGEAPEYRPPLRDGGAGAEAETFRHAQVGVTGFRIV